MYNIYIYFVAVFMSVFDWVLYVGFGGDVCAMSSTRITNMFPCVDPRITIYLCICTCIWFIIYMFV